MPEVEVKPWNRFLEFLVESTRIFRGFSMGLDAKKLAFGLAGVLVWALGSMGMNVLSRWPWALVLAGGALAVLLVLFFFARTDTEVASKNFVVTLVGLLLAIIVITGLLIWVSPDMRRIFPIFKTMWALVVASLFGTAVARIAAINAATEDTLGPRETTRFALRKFSTSLWTLLVPVVAILAYGLVLILVGLPGRISGVGYVWYVILGIVYILPLLGGLFFAAVLIVYLPSLILFQPAIAAEGNDSFDAVSRSYSYVFGKPWRLAFYAIVGFIYARIILMVAALLVVGAGEITNQFLGIGIGKRMLDKVQVLDLGVILGDPSGIGGYLGWTPAMNAVRHFTSGEVYESFSRAGSAGGWLVVFWQHVLLAIFLAFAVSLAYCVITQIYFLMRKAVDGTPLDEVYIETPEEEAFAAEFAGKPAAAQPTAPAAGEAAPAGEAPSEPAKPEVPPGITEPKREDEPPIELA